MLNEQEMQFADPDWKPTGALTAPTGSQPASTLANVPSPVSMPGTTNNQTYSAPQLADLPDYSQGYQGSLQEQPSSFQQMPGPQPQQAARWTPYQAGAQRRRGGSRWWIWAVIILICISLGGGAFNTARHSYPYTKAPGISQAPPLQGKQAFDLQGATQLNINDLSGDVTVVTAGDSQNVFVNTSDGSPLRVVHQGQSMTLTADGSGAITVIVPQNVALSLSTGENNIEVDGFAGQLIAQTGSGQIILNGDNLSQGSSLNTNSGGIEMGQQSSLTGTTVTSTSGSIALDQTNLNGQVTISTGGMGTITYNGALDPRGKYQFTTESGDIDLTVPMNSAMQLKVAQKSGHYSSDFPASAGSAPQAFVGLTTDSGNIAIHQY